MGRFILRRILLMIPTLLFISIISFIVIQAPPGDFFTLYISRLAGRGEFVDANTLETLRVQYGLDGPVIVQYFKWLGSILQGDFGRSIDWNVPVITLIAERLSWTIFISSTSLIFIYTVGIPIGVIGAVRQYSIMDYIFTLIGFIGLAVPNFLFALILLWSYFKATGNIAVGLFSKEFLMASWSFARIIDLMKHMWIPTIILGTAGTAGLIRTMRANLLDELPKPYVIVARSKGLSEARLLFKYPFRIAINPIISTIGWLLPALVGGEIIVSMVLGIPTMGPLFFKAIMAEDMLLASSIVLFLSTLTVVGTLISDILLCWLDPRIRGAV